jgi:hypothetical protein
MRFVEDSQLAKNNIGVKEAFYAEVQVVLVSIHPLNIVSRLSELIEMLKSGVKVGNLWDEVRGRFTAGEK